MTRFTLLLHLPQRKILLGVVGPVVVVKKATATAKNNGGAVTMLGKFSASAPPLTRTRSASVNSTSSDVILSDVILSMVSLFRLGLRAL